MILIRKNSSTLFGCFAAKSKHTNLLSSSFYLRTPFYHFTTNANGPSPKNLFIVNYLIDEVGLSSKEAAKASKLISSIKSPSNADAVREFFRENDFSDTDIKRIICLNSRLLKANVDVTLKPKFEALRGLGFSETQITKLVTANPYCLQSRSIYNLRPRIDFLSAFLGSNDDLVKAFSICVSLLICDFERNIKPKILFLRECQISDERIGSLMIRDQKIFGRSLNSFKAIAKRVNDLGIPYGSGMFYLAFSCFSKVGSEMVDAKLKFLGSLGFSSSEVLLAVVKHPFVLGLSNENMCKTVDFLVKEVGLELSYVISHPIIMSLSLTQRLIPRNYVWKLINKSGNLKKTVSFCSIVLPSEEKFKERFIFPFLEKVPELHDAFVFASANLNHILTSKSALRCNGRNNDEGRNNNEGRNNGEGRNNNDGNNNDSGGNNDEGCNNGKEHQNNVERGRDLH